MKARFLALAALVLGLASCQNDFDGASVGVGGEVDFQLSVAVPEFGATRADEDGQNGHDSAYGAIDYLSDAEWEKVDLRYTLEVYDLAAVNDPDAVPVKDRMTQVVDKYQPVSFDLRLVPGRDYRFVVFADFVDANGEGLHHTLGTNLRQITVKNDMISQELTDAYFATLDVEELANNATGDIELTRPYGKVRVIATDLHELNLNVKVGKTVVTYDACHPGMFNAVTGAIDSIYEQEYYEVVYGDEAYSAYTVGYDDDIDSATERLSHKTLFTDYILANETHQDAIHFTMSVYDKDDVLIKTTNFNTEIPVQRNYLTTVIGNVLTTATEINVTIDDNFKTPELKKDVVFVGTAAALQQALDNCAEGTTTILFENDIVGNVTVDQKEGVEVTIEGNDYNFAGYIVVDGKSAAYATAGLTIKDINFVAESIDADACIRLGVSGNNDTRYTNNVTVEGCTFNVPGAVGVKSYTGGDKNLKLSGCTATAAAHSLLQAKGIDGILVEKCAVYSKNGMNFNNSTNVVVNECTTDVKGYAARFGEGNAPTESGAAEVYTIKNSTLKSACEESGDAVIVLRGTADNATLTLVNTTIEGPRQIINNVEGAEVSVDGAPVVSDINAALAAGETNLYLTTGEYTMPAIQNKDVVISGSRDVVITVNKPNMSGANVVLNGVTVQASGYATGIQHVDTVTYNNVKVIGEMCLYGNKVDFNNCEFELAKGKYLWVYGCKNATFTGCEFNTAGKAILVYNEGAGANTVVVNGCKFNATAGDKAGDIANQNCAAIEINNYQNSGVGVAHNVTASDNTYSDNFSGEWRIKKFVAGAAITVNGVAYEQIALDGKLMDIDSNKNVTVRE